VSCELSEPNRQLTGGVRWRYPVDYRMTYRPISAGCRLVTVTTYNERLCGWALCLLDGRWHALAARPVCRRLGIYRTPEHAARRVYEHASK
jgi:hypothetical protein